MTSGGLHLQLLTTTFVRWGRTGMGTFEDGPLTDRAVTWMDLEDGTLPLEIPFTLPEGAQEYGRRRMTGWRFRTNNLIHDTGWRLAESPEAALEAARAYALTTEKVSGNRVLLEALKDVRAAVEWPPRTVETEKFRVTVTGTVARWERQTIAKGGEAPDLEEHHHGALGREAGLLGRHPPRSDLPGAVRPGAGHPQPGEVKGAAAHEAPSGVVRCAADGPPPRPPFTLPVGSDNFGRAVTFCARRWTKNGAPDVRADR